jgi:enoyl-CoA hydratase/carnithine racemase
MSMVEVSTEGAVATVTLNRPPVNALSEELSEELVAAFWECRDDAIRAVVVTGRPHFAAGADIKAFQEAHQSAEQHEVAGRLRDAVLALESLPKPTIAAVHGYALGGGLELAMAADFRYLASDATVGQPEITLGLIPGAGGTQRLTRLVGVQASKDLNYSGRHVAADEALALGLADKVLAPDELLEIASRDAAGWASGATRAIAAAKQAITGGLGRPLDEALEIERRAFMDVFWTDDATEGVSAFVEKRKPAFRNS